MSNRIEQEIEQEGVMSNRELRRRPLFWIVIVSAITAVVMILVLGLRGPARASAAPAAIPCPSGEAITVVAPSAGAPTTVSATVSPPVNLKPAKDGVVDSFHLHYFVDIDPSTVVRAGEPVPTGNPKIIHSATTTQDVGTLTAGNHRVWVVLGDVAHTACTPMVAGSVSFDVMAAAALPASGTGLAGGSASGSAVPMFAVALMAGLAAASAGFVMRRD